MNPKTDEELIRDIKGGDILAFEHIVRRYQARLLRFVGSFLPRHEQAQDVVQEAFFKLYRTIDRVDTGKKFSTYVYEIAKNTALSVLRSQKKEIPLEAVKNMQGDANVEENLIRKNRSDDVRLAVGSLETKYQDVIRLYYFDELSYEEIAHKLHIPVNTVRTHLKRAKARLKKAIHI